jgi:hypothetical protein
VDEFRIGPLTRMTFLAIYRYTSSIRMETVRI